MEVLHIAYYWGSRKESLLVHHNKCNMQNNICRVRVSFRAMPNQEESCVVAGVVDMTTLTSPTVFVRLGAAATIIEVVRGGAILAVVLDARSQSRAAWDCASV
jgi:hypothetical protein